MPSFYPSLVVVCGVVVCGVVACGLLIGGGASAGDYVAGHIPGPVVARVLEVIDGDTLKVEAQIWPGHSVVTKVRLAGVDAPEGSRAKCDGERRQGLAARQFLVEAIGSDPVRLGNIRSGKFGGRVIAQVRDGAGRDLAQLLIAQGHGRAYHGAKRDGWCGGGQETAFSGQASVPRQASQD